MKIQNKINQLLNNDLKIIVVAALYVISAHVGFLLKFNDINALPIWPPTGVAFALMLLLGYRIWPGIFIGSLITYSITFVNYNIPIDLNSISAISAITIANVVEVLLGYFLYKHLINEGTPYDRTGNTFKFLFISLVICLIGAGGYTGSLGMLGAINPYGLKVSFITSYLGSLTGLLLFTNLILSWVKGKTHWRLSPVSVAEAVISLFLVGLLFYLVETQSLSVAVERSFPFIIIPFLLWVSFRSTIQSATTFVLAISLFSVYVTTHGIGPFILDNSQNSIFLLQIFISVIGISTVILSSSVFERTEAKKKVEDFNETLEEAVVKRTKELDEEIKTRKKTEDKIRVSNRELRKINEELDNFVYKVSHDLRAPISSILGLVNIAKMDSKIKNVMECMQQIESSAIKQDEFIKDIIELTKNSRLEPSREKIDFKSLINESFDTLKYSLNTKPFKPSVKIKQSKNFYSDNNRLKVIFNNLLSNSIKYRSRKDPKIDIQIDVENGHADIAVSDNGTGIDKKFQKDVFKMFYRATDKNAGSGLGLYIVKETIEKLHGNIKLTSEIDKGTTISLRVPNISTGNSSKSHQKNKATA